MNDQDRIEYSYDDIFPERFLHAPDLDGRTVTLTITDIWGEYIQNPKQKRKKERGDLCGVLSFKGTKREYAMSKQNAWILKALWGKDPANIRGKRITLSPVPDGSGFTEHGTRILFTGSPDIDGDRALTLPGGQALTFKKTIGSNQTVVEGSVDPVTGEIGDGEAAPATQTPESGDAGAQTTMEPETGSSAGNGRAEQTPSQMAADLQTQAELKEQAKPITRKDVTWITTQATIHGVSDDDLYQWVIDQLGVEQLEDVPAARLDDLKAWIGSHEAS
jgi:hypothetical protein